YTLIEVRASNSDMAKPELTFMEDVTIKDGTIIAPGTPFRKTWKVRNTGNKVWDANYQLIFTSGDHMSGPNSVPLPLLRPNQQDNISVDLIAPAATGTVRSTWMAKDPDGNLFQYELYALINVQIPGTVNPAELFDAPVNVHYVRGYGYDVPTFYNTKHHG